MYTDVFNGQRVLITGGSGSLGKGFLDFLTLNPNVQPAKWIIFSRNWIEQNKLKEEYKHLPYLHFFLGDVRDKARLMRAFENVDIVIHAAAIKDIEACRLEPREAVLTNVIGTQNVIDACIDCAVYKAILISTDKSTYATTTYGMTKALAEKMWLDSTVYDPEGCKFTVAKYGNICGSAGSIIPKFVDLVSKGAKKLPLTHPEMTRYWMPMESAINFICVCLEFCYNRVNTPVLPSFKIIDLIEAFGCEPEIIGIRKDEKLHESMDAEHDSGSNGWKLGVSFLREAIKELTKGE